ncbi:MAG: lysophospholipid acyltransferase family protein [Dehalococcoidia bacterium]|nr:lysophospholipid acyltransferase family protein [Dehalococcoidia bacterium]
MTARSSDVPARGRASRVAGFSAAAQYRAWQAVTWVAMRLPPRVSYGIAGACATAGFYCWPRGRRAMLRNYQRVLHGAPSGEVQRTARASLVNYCRYLADFVRFPSLSPEQLRARCHGEESFANLDHALARGKGAIIVCMHFGNWDLGAGAAAARGYPLTVVAETFKDPRLDRMVMGARERLGMQVVRMEKAGPSLIRALRQNGLLALLIDRPVPGEGVKVQFFGEEIEVPAGPARLALRTGAAVVPTAFARTGPRDEVETLTDFSIDVQPTGDEAHDIHAVTQAIVAAHERFIRAHPEQWYMFREMWRTPRREAAIP